MDTSHNQAHGSTTMEHITNGQPNQPDNIMETSKEHSPTEPSQHKENWHGVEDTIQDPEEERVIMTALDSFSQYARVAHFNVTHLRRESFYALPREHWALLAGSPFNYLQTLDRVDAAIEQNARLAREIVRNGLLSVGLPVNGDVPSLPAAWAGVAKHDEVDKARSALRQVYRDWSVAGSREREVCYDPIIARIKQERDERLAQLPESQRPHAPRLNVLVPGAGLGRLVFDLAVAGFDVEGNEISYHMLMASSYLLNFTKAADQFKIYPWVHTFSCHVTRDHHLRGYPVPDIHPGTAMSQAIDPGSMSMSAADFLCLYSDEQHREVYDVVATVFFLDTAPNLIRYLQTIRHCLREGGLLINIGPLLWHFEGGNAPGNHGRDDDGDGMHDATNSSGIADPGSFELCEDEVMTLVRFVGFELLEMRPPVTTPYIQDPDSMLQTTYRSRMWVARKVPMENELGYTG